MTIIQIKGPIVSTNDKWLYDWWDMEATAPSDVILPSTGEPIEVHINSVGGDVYAGSEIYTTLKAYTGQVTVKVVGIAASAASVIAMAGDVVEVSPTAQMMIHNVASASYGDHRTFKHEAEVLENYNTSIANAYLAKTGKAMEDLLELMAYETWFTAEQAVANGFADKVMFAKEEVPSLVAHQQAMIPAHVVEKMAELKPVPVNIDKIVDKVLTKLAEKETVVKNAQASNEGFSRFLF